MPRPSRSRPKPKPKLKPVRKTARPPRVRWLRLIAPITLIVGSLVLWSLSPTDTAALRNQAETASREGRWSEALESWQAFNQTPDASASSLLAEAEVLLRLDRAAVAEKALQRATTANPSQLDPWLTWLELIRLEGRSVDALQVGWTAYESVSASARLSILRALTLALLADVPDAQALDVLGRFISADPEDIDARLALLGQRTSTGGRPAGIGNSLEERIAIVSDLLAQAPEHIGARAALVATLADLGAWEQARTWLDTWPESALDDPRYFQLLGRYELEAGESPARAVENLQKSLAILPHDWKTRARFAQALRSIGQEAEARAEAEKVERHREALDPSRLGPRLTRALETLNQPEGRLDLAELCATVGLDRLALAWRREAALAAGTDDG